MLLQLLAAMLNLTLRPNFKSFGRNNSQWFMKVFEHVHYVHIVIMMLIIIIK